MTSTAAITREINRTTNTLIVLNKQLQQQIQTKEPVNQWRQQWLDKVQLLVQDIKRLKNHFPLLYRNFRGAIYWMRVRNHVYKDRGKTHSQYRLRQYDLSWRIMLHKLRTRLANDFKR